MTARKRTEPRHSNGGTAPQTGTGRHRKATGAKA